MYIKENDKEARGERKLYENFLKWLQVVPLGLQRLFLPAVSHLTKTAPVILFQDDHHSHISLGVGKQPLCFGNICSVVDKNSVLDSSRTDTSMSFVESGAVGLPFESTLNS